MRRAALGACQCAAWLAVVVPLALGHAQQPAPPVPDDRAVSAGRWDVVSADWEGRPVDREFLAHLQVVYRADGSWAVLFKNRPVAEGRSSNRQDVTPKTFEMETLGSGPIEPRRYKGIYRLDGDTRMLCIVPEGRPLPGEFTAPRRSGRMLVMLKRSAAQ